MRELTSGRGRQVPNLVASILKDALVLRECHQAGKVSASELALRVVGLEARVEGLLARPAIVQDGNRRLLKHLGRECDHLFTFLRHPALGVLATNWRAEQGRPAGGGPLDLGSVIPDAMTESINKHLRDR